MTLQVFNLLILFLDTLRFSPVVFSFQHPKRHVCGLHSYQSSPLWVNIHSICRRFGGLVGDASLGRGF